MKNRVINQYGAANTEIGKQAEAILAQFEFSIRELDQKHSLTPEEIRCLESCLKPSVFAELTLTRAMQMKKDEKLSGKPSAENPEIATPSPTVEKEIEKGTIVLYNGGHMRVTARFHKHVNLGPVWAGKTTIKKVYIGEVYIGEVKEDQAGFYKAWEQSEAYQSM
jgi:hypothetical protein